MPSPVIWNDVDADSSHCQWTLILILPSCGQALSAIVEPGHELETADDCGLEAVDVRRHFVRLDGCRPRGTVQPVLLRSMLTSLARSLAASTRISFDQTLNDRPWAIVAISADHRLDVFEQLRHLSLRAPASGRTVSPADPKCVLDEAGDLARTWPRPAASAGPGSVMVTRP